MFDIKQEDCKNLINILMHFLNLSQKNMEQLEKISKKHEAIEKKSEKLK